jgi:hypothetical protein
MNNKHWYQDGWVVLGVVFGTGLLYLLLFTSPTPMVYPRLLARVDQPFLSSPEFVVSVFHQHPAKLNQVILKVRVSQQIALDHREWPEQVHSFEAWGPNQDQEVSFTFPLPAYDPDKDVGIEVILEGQGVKRTLTFARWKNGAWMR